ncbi:MAG: YitT family protein [Clostridium sp.]|nr:YitT family protein [Clostridium sp.]
MIKSQQLWMSTRDYLLIALGILSYAVGFTAFIFPEKVVIGGLAGFGTLVYFVTEKAFGWGIPVAVTQYITNMILLAFAYKTVGKQFVIRTIYGATVISLFIGVLQPMFTEPLIPDQPFMNVLLGGILCGLGIGFVFVHNGSTGGTDIVAAIVSKKSNTSVGRTMLYCDFCIISSSYLLFHQFDTVVYGFIVLFCVSYLTDFFINSNRQAMQFIIFSRKWQEIATAINTDAHRGCTVLDAMGWYSKEEIKVLLVICRKQESVLLLRIIQSTDPEAFVSQANVNGVYGKGFDKIRLKAEHHSKNKNRGAADLPAARN